MSHHSDGFWEEMAEAEHLAKLREGVGPWNDWRDENEDIVPFLNGAHLRGEDLRGAHLSEAYLGNAMLSGAMLSGADLSRADLHGADLNGADLSGADLQGANLGSANLQEAVLSVANLNGANLRGADLRGADLRGAYMSGVILYGANLERAGLKNAYLYGCDLGGAILRGADLEEAELYVADLRWAKLNSATLVGANLRGAQLNEADLSLATLDGADLSLASLVKANLTGARLNGVCLDHANRLEWVIADVLCDYIVQLTPEKKEIPFGPQEFERKYARTGFVSELTLNISFNEAAGFICSFIARAINTCAGSSVIVPQGAESLSDSETGFTFLVLSEEFHKKWNEAMETTLKGALNEYFAGNPLPSLDGETTDAGSETFKGRVIEFHTRLGRAQMEVDAIVGKVFE